MFDLICPYCFSKFSKRRLIYRCPDDGQCFERKHFYGVMRCPSCGSDATASACCPICGSVIPAKARGAHFSSIAVVGAGLSGKTVYLTVALNELRNNVGFLATSPLTRDTSLWFNKNREDLYVNGHLLEATQPVRQPLIWSVTNTRHRRRNSFSNHTITFLDTCGDLTSTVDILVTEYLKNCSSILFVVDPLMLQGVQKTVVGKDEDVTASLAGSYYSNDKNVTEIIDVIARKIRDVRGISNHKKLGIPFALVLTKMDLINTMYTQKTEEMRECQPNRSLDYERGNQRSEVVEKWLRDIGEESLLSAVANNFSVYSLFSVSSLGSSPRRINSTYYYTCDSIKPYGVLDPLWWIFKNNHIVD